MEKILKGKKLVGFQIGELVHIHEHVHDPENWLITIRPLLIFGKTLCAKTCTESEIARYVNVLLHKKLKTINSIILDVIPFT